MDNAHKSSKRKQSVSLQCDQFVEFKCPHLRECLRQIMEIGKRVITVGYMEKLNMSLVQETELRSCVDLDLRNHKISEISPLSVLTNLTSLGIDSCHIKDFTPLNQLSSFEKLWIYPKRKNRNSQYR